jgi:hypothetical protein
MAAAFLSDEGSGLGASVMRADSSSSVIVIPDAHLLFSAHFSRSGPDLVLTGADGRHHLVPGYFSSEHPPALAAPNGATLSAEVIGLMAGSPTPNEYAQAGTPTAPQSIGQVEKVVGTATVIRNGVSITLNVGDAVYKSDVIETGADSKVGIGFPDGTALQLLANTRMALNEYSYDPNGHSNSALFTYVEGTFGFFAGKVAHTGDMKIDTPIATMGIRGTTGVMGQGTDPTGHSFYWQSIYDDPGTNISGSWDDFGKNPDGTTAVEITVSQTGEMTVFTLQGPGLPPLITVIPLPASYNLIALAIIDDLTDIIRLLSVEPHSLPSPGSPENPFEVLPPEFVPGAGNGPQPIYYIPITPPGGGPPVIIPIIGPPISPPGTQAGFIWPTGSGTWDTALGWTGDQVPIAAIDTVTIESGIVQYGNGGADTYFINELTIDSPAELDVIGGTLNVENGLDDGGVLLVEDPPSSGPALTVSGPVTVEAGARLVAKGDGALIDLTLATVDNSGTIAARYGGYVEIIDSSVTNEATGKIRSVGPGLGIDFSGVDFDNAGHVVAKDCGSVVFVDSSVTNETGGRLTAKDFGSISFSDTDVDNYGLIRAISGGFIKFESSVINDSGGEIRSAGCDSCVVFICDELDNSGIVIAARGGIVKFLDETIVNEAAATVDSVTVPGGAIEAKDRGLVKVDGGTFTNQSGALVEATHHGTVEIKNAFVLNDAGTFEATDCGIICVGGCGGSVTNDDGQFVAENFGTIVFDRLSGVVNEDGGKIEAKDHGRVVLADVSVTNYDQSEGRHDRAGDGVIEAIGCGASVDLADATINGGKIETRDGGIIETVYGCNTFLNVTLDGAVVRVDCDTSLALDGGRSGIAAVIDGIVRLEGPGLVTMAYESYQIVAGRHGGTLVNATTISGLGQIGVGDGALIFINCGTVDAHTIGPGHGDAFIIDTGTGECGAPTTFNTGTLEACGPCAELLIEDTTLDNCGGLIAAIGWGATVDLDLSFIAGGDLETRFGGLIQTVDGNSTFDGVTIDHGSEIKVNDGTSLTLEATIHNHGTIEVDGGRGADLIIDGTVTLDGNGTVTLDGKNDKIVGDSLGSTLDNVNDKISGFGEIGGDKLTFDNGQNGTVDANVAGKTLILDTGGNAARNSGTLKSTHGGILKIKSNVDNAGGTIGAFGAGSLTELISVTIKGGTLATGDPYWLDDGVIAIVAVGCATTSVFDGVNHAVTVEGFVQVDPDAQLELKGNIDNNGGTIDVDQGIVHGHPAGSDLLIDGVVTLSGDGAIALEGNCTGIVAVCGGGTLDNESYIYGSRGGYIGTGNEALTFNNSGTVNSEAGAAGPLVIDTGGNTITNTGTLEATAGSELDLYGTIDNAGGTIAASAEGYLPIDGYSPTVVKLFGVTIEGGTLVTDDLTASDGGMIEVTTDGTSVFDGSTQKVTVDGYVQVDAGADLEFIGKVVDQGGKIGNLGTIDINGGSSGADLVIHETVRLGGGGLVTLDGSGDQITGGGATAMLNNINDTISGFGTIGDGTTDLKFNNEANGTVDADLKGDILTVAIGANEITNAGVFQASNGGILDVNSTVDNTAGLIKVGAGISTADFADAVTGGNATISGGKLEFASTSNVTVAFDNGSGDSPKYGVLDLTNAGTAAGAFTGEIADFSGVGPSLSQSDAIDLGGFRIGKTTITGDTFNAGQDTTTLTVVDSADHLSTSLIFQGNYVGDFVLKGDGNGGTNIFDPPAGGSAGSSVSIGGPGNDNFIFHPGLGGRGASFTSWHDDFAFENSAHTETVQQLQSLVTSDVHEHAFMDFGHHDSIALPDAPAGHWSATLQSAVHLH